MKLRLAWVAILGATGCFDSLPQRSADAGVGPDDALAEDRGVGGEASASDTGGVAPDDAASAVDAAGDLGEDSGGFDSGRFDSGRFDSGGFDSGGFDSGGAPQDGGPSLDGGVAPRDVTVPRDTGPAPLDVPPRDGGVLPLDVLLVRDTGAVDTGAVDTGAVDTGAADAGSGALRRCRALVGRRPAVMAPTAVRGLSAGEASGWLGSPAVGDVNGDGRPDIVLARNAQVFVYTGAGALRLTLSPAAGRIWSSPVLADLTGDGRPEIAVAAGDRVFAWDGVGGALVRGFPARWRSELRSLAAGDLNGDGRAELVSATTTPNTAPRDLFAVFQGDGTPLSGWPAFATGAARCDSTCSLAGAYDQNVGLGDLNGDGRLDLVGPMDNAYITWHHASGEAFLLAPNRYRNATRAASLRMFLNEADAVRGYALNETTALQAHFTNSPPAVADLDDDGRREMIVLSSVQNAAQTNRRLGVALWALRADGTRLPAFASPFAVQGYLGGLEDLGGNIVAQTNQPAVADLDPTRPGNDVVFAGFDGRLHAVGADGVARWSYTFSTTADVLTAGVALVDLNGDALPETVFATYSTRSNVSALMVLSSTGALLHRVALPGRGAMAVPTVADLDLDGTLEVVVHLKDSVALGSVAAQVFTVPGSATNCMPWPTGRGSMLRDGQPTL
ncbi:MAG: VCBS repeat-containing protein [Myxococcales bacterium]|nr:VCBS repeat-containing protein [Myxococcales bacterium]